MTESKKVTFVSGMEEDSYVLESEELRPLMLEKITKNARKFGTLEAWLSVYRQEVATYQIQAERAVLLWWINRKQLEFAERHALETATEDVGGLSPVTPA